MASSALQESQNNDSVSDHFETQNKVMQFNCKLLIILNWEVLIFVLVSNNALNENNAKKIRKSTRVNHPSPKKSRIK